MEKTSGLGLLSKVYIGSEGLRGAKEAKKTMKLPNINQFDEILKNKPVKAKNIFSSASNIIDKLCIEKLSYQENNEKKKKKSLVPYIIGASILGAGLPQAIRTGNPLRPVRDALSVFKDWQKFPKIVFGRKLRPIFEGIRKSKEIVGKGKKSGYGDKSQNKLTQYYLPGVVFGGGMGAGNLGVHLLGEKYFDKKTVKRSHDSFPSASVEMYRRNRSKRASDIINENYIEKTSVQLKGKDFAKKLFVEDFLQNSLRTIPFTLTPLAVSHAINRNLKSDFSPVRGNKKKQDVDRIIIEIPRERLIKTAKFRSFNIGKGKKFTGYKKTPFKASEKAEIGSWPDFFKYRVPEAAVRSLSWFGVPAALTMLTGRNIRGIGEKVRQDDIDPEKVRITVDRSSKYKDSNALSDAARMSRMASLNNNEIEKSADVRKDIAKMVKNILSENKKLKAVNARVITQGIQKQKPMKG